MFQGSSRFCRVNLLKLVRWHFKADVHCRISPQFETKNEISGTIAIRWERNLNILINSVE